MRHMVHGSRQQCCACHQGCVVRVGETTNPRSLMRDYLWMPVPAAAIALLGITALVIWGIADPRQHAPTSALLGPLLLLAVFIGGLVAARWLNFTSWVQVLSGYDPGGPLEWSFMFGRSQESSDDCPSAAPESPSEQALPADSRALH